VAGEWRLPNVRELLSLIDYGQEDPALPLGHPLIDVQSSWYWLSSSYSADPVGAWVVDLSDGYMEASFKGNSKNVWPVRGGQ
jgi:hypothetical protein